MVDLDAVLGGVREHYTPEAGTQKRVRTAVTAALVAGGATVASGTATASGAGNAVATGGAASVAKVTAAGLAWTKLAAGVSIVAAMAGSGALLWQDTADVEPAQQVQLPITHPSPTERSEAVAHAASAEAREAAAPNASPRASVVAASTGGPQAVPVNNRVATAAPVRRRSDRSESRSPEPSMLHELRMLGDASRSLRNGHVEEASRLLQEHAKRYPTSTLKSERWGMQLLLRCSQASGGVSDDTRRAAERFVRGAPSSPLARHIRRECFE